MDSFLDSKLMAKRLRQALAERQIEVSHSDSLELIARQFGLPNWNVLSAAIDATQERDATAALPDGWVTSGTAPELFRARLDDVHGPAMLIESREELGTPSSGSFCTVMQSVLADDYRGQRVRVSAELRGRDIAGGGTIWFRVDGPNNARLRFDNLESSTAQKPLSASIGWTARHVVFDVPEAAESLHFGFFLKGAGKLWARLFLVEIVGDDVDTTGPQQYGPKPVNLDFRQPRAH